jgi:hypothetical protein
MSKIPGIEYNIDKQSESNPLSEEEPGPVNKIFSRKLSRNKKSYKRKKSKGKKKISRTSFSPSSPSSRSRPSSSPSPSRSSSSPNSPSPFSPSSTDLLILDPGNFEPEPLPAIWAVGDRTVGLQDARYGTRGWAGPNLEMRWRPDDLFIPGPDPYIYGNVMRDREQFNTYYPVLMRWLATYGTMQGSQGTELPRSPIQQLSRLSRGPSRGPLVPGAPRTGPSQQAPQQIVQEPLQLFQGPSQGPPAPGVPETGPPAPGIPGTGPPAPGVPGTGPSLQFVQEPIQLSREPGYQFSREPPPQQQVFSGQLQPEQQEPQPVSQQTERINLTPAAQTYLDNIIRTHNQLQQEHKQLFEAVAKILATNPRMTNLANLEMPVEIINTSMIPVDSRDTFYRYMRDTVKQNVMKILDRIENLYGAVRQYISSGSQRNIDEFYRFKGTNKFVPPIPGPPGPESQTIPDPIKSGLEQIFSMAGGQRRKKIVNFIRNDVHVSGYYWLPAHCRNMMAR